MQLGTAIRNRGKTFSRQNGYTRFSHSTDDIFISIMSISSPNSMFDHLLESSNRDDSNKWSKIGFGEEITQIESNKINF